MLRHLLLGFGTFALAQTASAQTPAHRIAFDGVTAEYTRSVDAAGALHLQGRVLETGEDFHFTVPPSGQASGHVGNRAVVFQVRRATREAALNGAKPRQDLAARETVLASGDAALP